MSDNNVNLREKNERQLRHMIEVFESVDKKAAMSDREPLLAQALDFLLDLQARPDDRACRTRLEGWLAQDDRHRAAWRSAQHAWRIGGAAMRPSPVRRLVGGVALAASLLLALFWGLDLADYSAGTAAQAAISLEDGSQVDLDGGTALDVAFSPDRRSVTLRQGDAFFQVAANPARPFQVHAGAMVVTVLGTAFDVRMTEKSVMVAVAHGRVAVTIDGRDNLLLPGDSLILSRRDSRVTRGRLDVSAVAAWRDGQLVADDMTLADLAEILRRHSHSPIFLTDRDLAGKKVTGLFDLDHPASALRAAAASHGGLVRDWGAAILVSAGK